MDNTNNFQGGQTSTVCPHCGKCPHCGQSASPGYQPYPYITWTTPYGPYFGGTSTVSGISTGVITNGQFSIAKDS